MNHRDDNTMDRKANDAQPNKELYRFIDEWEGNTMYRYIVITLIVIFVATRIGGTPVSFLIGMITAHQILNYLNNREIMSNVSTNDLYKKKVDAIVPKLNRTVAYEAVTHIIFTIQDLYRYNPLAFYEMNKLIEAFFELYEKIETDHTIAHREIDRLIDHKRGVLNCMHSLLFSLPNDPAVRYKSDQTIGDMDTELTRYVDHVSYHMDDEIYKNGYTNSTKLFEPTKPSNVYRDIDLPYTYEIY